MTCHICGRPIPPDDETMIMVDGAWQRVHLACAFPADPGGDDAKA